jgi:prepilin-type processing-associated H-X9-DG protein
MFNADKTLVWDQQYQQIYLFSNYIRPLTFFRCPLSRGDVNDPAWSSVWHTPTPVDGVIQWTEYKLNDDGALVDDDLGVMLRPPKVVMVIDAMDGSPRHRGKSNLCFADGHVELLSQSIYSGKEPGMPATAPDGWWNWGLRDL